MALRNIPELLQEIHYQKKQCMLKDFKNSTDLMKFAFIVEWKKVTAFPFKKSEMSKMTKYYSFPTTTTKRLHRTSLNQD